MFDRLYEVTFSEKVPFGRRWCGPLRFLDEGWQLIAQYPKEPDNGDGQSVDVFCDAMPARFYKIRALPGANSVGEPQNTYEITTGTVSAELVAQIAESISQGMICVRNFCDNEAPVRCVSGREEK